MAGLLIGFCLAFGPPVLAIESPSSYPDPPSTTQVRTLGGKDIPSPASAFSVLGPIVHGPIARADGAPAEAPLSADEVPDPRSRIASTARCPTGWFQIGRSVRGRPILACRMGSGTTRLALLGGIHGGWERKTTTLVEQFLLYFVINPSAIPAGLVVYFVPATNPDGLARGTDSASAWNARGVDLNRNFDSGNWSRNTYGIPGGRYGPTGTRIGGGGTAPFSEPESRAIRDFVRGRRIGTVLSYHGGIASVSAKNGGGGVGESIARLIARSTGYPYVAKWTAYRLTGQLVDWLDRVRVRGVDVDLPDRHRLDYWNNLRALRAVMARLVGR